MSTKNYIGSETKKQESELASAFYRLQTAREEYTGLVNNLEVVGHRLQNTNYPTVESANKSMQPEKAEGLLFDIINEIDIITRINAKLSELVGKFDRII